MKRVEINTELLYSERERTEARRMYYSDHPRCADWRNADPAIRDEYLGAVGRPRLDPAPTPRRRARVPRRWLIAAPLTLALLWVLGVVSALSDGFPLVTTMLRSLVAVGASLALAAVFGGIAWWAASGDR